MPRTSRSLPEVPRRWLGAWVIGALAALGAGKGRAQPVRDGPIAQPDRAEPAAFMARAFAMRERAAREGDQPFGAVVVQGGRIVGEAPSRVITRADPTAHAEMEAIRDAARRLGTRSLGDCVIYASSRPCPMCEAAAYWAGVSRLYHGGDIADAGAPRLCR